MYPRSAETGMGIIGRLGIGPAEDRGHILEESKKMSPSAEQVGGLHCQ